MAKKKLPVEELEFRLIVNGDQAQKEMYETEKAIRDLKDTGKALRAERAKLAAQDKKGTEEYKRLTAAIKANSAEVKENETKLQALQKRVGITGMTLAQLQKEAKRLQLQLRHMVPGSAQYKKLEADLVAVNTRIKELRGSAVAAEGSLSRLAQGFNKYAALGASFIASLTGIVLSMQKVIDYNGKLSDSLADTRKTTGLTADEVDELAKSFGAFNTRTSRMELLKLAEDAGRLGITGVENLRAYTEQANKLRVALKDDLSETQIMEIGKMVNIYKVGEATAKDFAGSMDALGSAINEVSYSGANQAGFLVEYLKRQAGIAAQTRISAADNVGYAATFDEIGQSVEISATMMNKVFIDMFENTSEYAQIAGMDLQEFSTLLNTDANEAMLKFLEGLNGNNEGLGVMVQKIEKLNAGGTRGVQALAALASSTDLVRSRQETANRALQEATSLTDEYNIKNNNLAAILEKINFRIRAMMSGEGLTGFLTMVVTGFGKLIGAVKDVNKELDRNIKLSFESAASSLKQAVEAEKLLKRYESLTKDGLVPSAEAKMELDEITLKLKDSFGDSVVEINKETGAIMLNTEKVREQIQAKRLAADQEAATNASRLIGVRQEKEQAAERIKITANEYIMRKKIFEERFKDDIAAIRSSKLLSAAEKQRELERLEGYKALDKARVVYQQADEDMAQLLRREKELIDGLKELNFNADDAINALLGDTGTTPDEIVIPTITGGAGEDRTKLLERLNKEILAATQANEDNRIALLEDSYLEELAAMQYAHDRKLEVLREQILSEEEILRQPFELREKYRDRNEAVQRQIESAEEVHTFRMSALVHKGMAQQLSEQQEQYNREKTLREQKYAEELLKYSGHKEQQDELRKKHQEEELTEQAKFLEEQLRQMEEILGQGEFGGMNLDLLTDEQREHIEANLEEVRLKILEVKNAKDSLKGEGEADGLDLGAAGDIDFFGFTADEWKEMFSNLETLEDMVAAAGMAVQGMMNAWGDYTRFVNENENKRYKVFEKNNNRQRQELKNRLDDGVLSQRQYDRAVQALEQEQEKRKAELEYNQAMRAWKMKVTEAIANTAMATINGYNTQPFFPLGLAMGTLAGVLGTLQIAMVKKNKPVRGFEEGLYPDYLFPVEREQDGKMFNARHGGQAKSGMVNEPTILVGEKPELIISNPDLKNFDPDIRRTMFNEIRRLKGYEEGYISPSVQRSMESTVSEADNSLLMELVVENIALLRELRESGVMAYLVRDMENTKKLQDDLDRLKKYKEKAKI